ncbi:MAG: SBBP repeat-containing protein, partial [Candidatus Eisenbacteria bacterium]
MPRTLLLRPTLVLLLSVTAESATAALATPRASALATQVAAPSASNALAGIPLHFIPNLGQFDPATHFVGFVPGATVRFATGSVTYQFRRPLLESRSADPNGADLLGRGTPPKVEALEIHATFPGANPAPHVSGAGETAHRSHFYLGNDPARWRTDVPAYAAVRLSDLYPGIDLEYHGRGRELEYDFHVAPGADPRRIRVHYEGVERLGVTPRGELEVTTRFGRTIEAAPVAYQVIGGERRPVRARYRLVDAHTFAFAVDRRPDPKLPLVIDPVLKYSTFLGGISYDEVHEIVSDIPGNAYVVGGTLSPDFPASGTPVPSTKYSVFLTKIAPNGGSLVYSVFLGGSEDQIGYGLRVDLAGNAYIAGVTGSNNFPTTTGAYDVTFNGTNPGEVDLFVAKFSPAGTLLY